MSTPTSPNIGLFEPAYNSFINSWQTPVNSNWTAIDTAFGGVGALTSTEGTVVLTLAQYLPRNMVATGTLTGNVTYQLPAVGGFWTVWNNTTGSFTVTFATNVAGRSVTVTQGNRALIVSDGQNVDLALTPQSVPTPITGNFEPTIGGVSGTSTVACNYTLWGNLVAVNISYVALTSNSTEFYLSDWPSDLMPSSNTSLPIGIMQNNGVYVSTASGVFEPVDTPNTLSFALNGSLTGWSAGGTKGIGFMNFIFPISHTFSAQLTYTLM